ncbi:MAG: D-2-hydroxyacid dehydrogenase [Clostridiaceae bacterium]|nr:D-2-hydroxyacid dehydrogenase [Clostridiaceae bacterium]
MKVLVTLPCKEEHKALLKGAYPDASFVYIPASELTSADVADVEITIGNMPSVLLADCKKLRWLQLNSAGADQYLGKMPEGAMLTNATGAYGLAISEHMLGMLLAIMKKLHVYYDNQHAHLWRDEGPVWAIEGSTALILGAGDIGGDFARKVHALGAYTIGVRRTATKKDAWLDELHRMEALDELLPRADIIAMCLPGTQETKGIINAERLAMMKKNAIILNIGRGTAIDTEALCDALEKRQIGGAGLDVTDPEPLPPDHRLWDMPNAIVTPHISGFYHLQQTFDRIVRISAENLAAFREGKQLRNVINEKIGYRTLREE